MLAQKTLIHRKETLLDQCFIKRFHPSAYNKVQSVISHEPRMVELMPRMVEGNTDPRNTARVSVPSVAGGRARVIVGGGGR